ncbi:M28 family peptidase [Aliiglaciecola sp.]|nr:M28 family peptidase [Aliiglaciecola sp.]
MSVNQNKASSLTSLFVSFLIVGSILLTWYAQLPANDQTFFVFGEPVSLTDTQSHIKTMSRHPHYTGNSNHQDVTDYIVQQLTELGLEVDIQQQLATSSKRFVAANVKNIIAKIPATSPSNTTAGLALMSHYDSSNTSSFGASDAAHGVAVIIESVKALIASNESFSNDVYVIITDAEEQGLLGAEAFIRYHPWAKNIALTLNLEARGSGGVSYTLLETNDGNKGLIDAFSNAGVPYPAANSLMYSIYKMLPNDTDLTVFREQGDIKGFNFAFIDDHFDYHTAQDTYERLDTNTLNHQISYITSLLSHFSNIDLQSLDSQEDHVYFNLGSISMVDYPFSWVVPMLILSIFLFFILCWRVSKKGQLAFRDTALAFIPAILVLALAYLIGSFGWQLLVWLFPQFIDIPQGFTYSGHYIIATFILLTLSLGAWLYHFFVLRFTDVSPTSWYFPVIVVWILVNTGFAFYLAGAGFFIITVFGALISLYLLYAPKINANQLAIGVALSNLPALIIITPQIPVFVIGLGLSNLLIGTVLSILVFMLLLPLIFVMKGVRSIQLFLLAGALISFVGVVQNAEYSVSQKKPTSINYVEDTQTRDAYLFTFNRRLDDFTSQFFSQADRNNQALNSIYPINRWRNPTYVTKATSLNVNAASYLAKRSLNQDGSTSITLRVTPKRELTKLEISTDKPLQITQAIINGTAIDIERSRPRKGFVFRYVVTDEQPINLKLTYQSESQVELRIVEFSGDFMKRYPNVKERAEHIMPTPFRPSDMLITSQLISFE